MKNLLFKMRSHFYLKFYYAVFVFLWGIAGTLLLIFRALFSESPSASFIITATYFTTQSNVLITLIVLLFLLGFSNKKWFKCLFFIGLINILITCLVFHTLLVPYMSHVSFLQQMLHTINPILFIGLYFIFFEAQVPYRKFWIVLIHPLIFLLAVYLFFEPFFGDMFQNTLGDIPGVRYVYPFLDPQNYDHGIVGLIGFNLGILTPVICLLSLLLIYLKKKLDIFIQ